MQTVTKLQLWLIVHVKWCDLNFWNLSIVQASYNLFFINFFPLPQCEPPPRLFIEEVEIFENHRKVVGVGKIFLKNIVGVNTAFYL